MGKASKPFLSLALVLAMGLGTVAFTGCAAQSSASSSASAASTSAASASAASDEHSDSSDDQDDCYGDDLPAVKSK